MVPEIQKLNLVKIMNKYGKVGKYLHRVYTQPQYANVIQDLSAYTGLDELDLLGMVLLKPNMVGHFVREFEFHNPKTNPQVSWFYRAAQGYLFGNANRTYWEKLSFIKKQHEPFLDYGGGIGNNTIPLAMKGFLVDYFDISIIQRDFVKFRGKVRRAIGSNLKVMDGYTSHVFDYLDFADKMCSDYYGTIILQDVLEHIPNYQFLLKILCTKLRRGGMIVEYSPFRTETLNSIVHFPEKYLLTKAMAENGMERADMATIMDLYKLKKVENMDEHRGIWIRQ